MRDVLGRVLDTYGEYTKGPNAPVITERPLETPMAFAYGAQDEETDAEKTAHDPADSQRTARRDSLSEEAAGALLRQVDGEVEEPEDVNATQELSADDVLESADTAEASQAITVQIPPEPATLESLPSAPSTLPELETGSTEVPAASGTLPSLPPSPESTPTLPASEAPKTPLVTATAAPASVPASNPEPSSGPTVIAPKSMGVPSRKHTDLFEDLARRATPQARLLAGALTGGARPAARISHGDHPKVKPIVDLTREEETVRSDDASGSGPRTMPYPFQSPVDPELAPPTEPASLPIPLVPFELAPTKPRATAVVEVAAPLQSRPIPLARLIETTIQSEGASQSARPTLESAQPVAIAEPPKTEGIAPSIWSHGAQKPASDRVRPLILPDMSGAVPAQPAFDPRVAHVDYAEGLARRQHAQRAAQAKIAPLLPEVDASAPLPTSKRGRSKTLLIAFAAFAALIAATLFCAGVLMLQQNGTSGATASQPTRAKSQPARASLAAASKQGVAEVSALPGVSRSDTVASTTKSENGIPVLAVDLLPKAVNNRGMLHVGKQFDGHRIFVDGSVVGNGSGDYDLLCGKHGVKVGSQDRSRPIVMPCGGELTLE